jgi:hypothetical protein
MLLSGCPLFPKCGKHSEELLYEGGEKTLRSQREKETETKSATKE